VATERGDGCAGSVSKHMMDDILVFYLIDYQIVVSLKTSVSHI